MEAARGPVPCSRAQELLDQVQTCVERVRAISDEEIDALVKRDFARLNRLREQMTRTRERKAALLDEFDAHTQAHGC